MSWRETINAQSAGGRSFMGSLSGVPFMVPSNQMQGGRRTAVHELPQHDLPIIDDLGAKAKSFTLQVFVDGSLASTGNYIDARDRLLNVLDKPGPMTLIHPWLGQMRVSQSRPWRMEEKHQAGGRATFDLALIVDTGLTLAPSGSVDTQGAVADAAEVLQQSALDDFAAKWSVDNLPSWGLTELESDLTNTIGKVEKVVSGVTNAIAAQVRAPYNMGSALIGAVNQIKSSIAVPLNAFDLYKALFNAGDDSQSVTPTTPLRTQQANSAWTLHQTTQLAAISQAAVLSGELDYDSSDAALNTLNDLLETIDAHLLAVNPATNEPIADAVYLSLDSLRAALTTDMKKRVARLPEVVTFTPAATLPTLALAWQLYGDASRNEEIAQRNKLRWPGFVSGGQPLEVLNV